MSIKLDEVKLALLLAGFGYHYVDFSDYPWHTWKTKRIEINFDTRNDYLAYALTTRFGYLKVYTIKQLMEEITGDSNGNIKRVKKTISTSKNRITFS